MNIRKSVTRLTPEERDDFLVAVLTLKNTIANHNDPVDCQINIYDQFVATHFAVRRITTPNGGTVNMGHGGPAFGPWHREYLIRYEQALQSVNPNVTLPYWDWLDHEGTRDILFQNDFIGARDGELVSGYFAFNAPGTGNNTTAKPAWWPSGLEGWRLRPSLAFLGTTLFRRLNTRSLPIEEDVYRTLARSEYEDVNTDIEDDPLLIDIPRRRPRGFRNRVEEGLRMHNYLHGWVGGHMGDPTTSPNDPMFFLHHCNVDRLWAMWQINGHRGDEHYPGENSGEKEGHKLDDPMWPWIGNLPNYTSREPNDIVLPNYTAEPVRRAVDVLDHRALEYMYETLYLVLY